MNSITRKDLTAINDELKTLKLLVEELTHKPQPVLGEWVSEEDLKRMLKRGTTWCWEMRKKGLLDYAKIGSENYYSMKSLERLFEANRIKAYRRA